MTEDVDPLGLRVRDECQYKGHTLCGIWIIWYTSLRSEVVRKINRTITKPMTRLYSCSHFTHRREARRLYVIFAAFPIPPDVVKTRGVNEPFSTSQIRCLYACLFSPSCRLKHKSKDRLQYVGAFGLKPLHQNAHTDAVAPRTPVL